MAICQGRARPAGSTAQRDGARPAAAVTLADNNDTTVESADDEACHTTVPDEECWDEIQWAMHDGLAGHPEWYPGLNASSAIALWQERVHSSGNKKCPKPCLDKSAALRAKCDPPQVPDEYGSCRAPASPARMTFYMYRAQDNHNYRVENLNLASLAGVMWYLHREVVGSRPRKFHITRILRYKVTMKNTEDLYDKFNKQFGPFVAFDSGSAKGRSEIWQKYGFVVGCQLVDPDLYNYVPNHTLQPGCYPRSSPVCNSGKWYSLPGPCPEEKFTGKTEACKARWPGGLCPSAVVTGEHSCTYWAEFAGEVRLDQLEGIRDYDKWWIGHNSKGGELPNGNVEYNSTLDAGIGMDFWDGGQDRENCTRRMDKLTRMFKKLYPALPESLPEPSCD